MKKNKENSPETSISPCSKYKMVTGLTIGSTENPFVSFRQKSKESTAKLDLNKAGFKNTQIYAERKQKATGFGITLCKIEPDSAASLEESPDNFVKKLKREVDHEKELITERLRSSMAQGLADYAEELQRFRDDELRLRQEEERMVAAQKAEAERMAWLEQEQQRLKAEMEAAH